MKRFIVKSVVLAGFALLALESVAYADGETATIPAKKAAKAQHARHAAPLSDEEKLARDYRARRAAGDNRNCPCAGNPGNYCSCDSYHGGYGYYGYGYYGNDQYDTAAGWSRGWGHSSDIPTAGYTGTYHR